MWTNAFTTSDLGAHIARLRRERGFSQADFAAQLGVSRPTLSSLENGRSVSTTLLMNALSLLGSRLIAAPRSAEVTVTERQTGTAPGHGGERA